MTDRVRSPLRVVLVVSPELALADYQALLIERLQVDPKIELAGRITGAYQRNAPPLSVAVRTALACERMLLGSRILAYDTKPAQRIMESLPDSTYDEGSGLFDLALVLGGYALTPDTLDIARFGEWSVSFAGSVDPDWMTILPKVRSQPHIKVEILTRSAQNFDSVVLSGARYNMKPGAVLTGAFIAEKSCLLVHHALRDLAEGQPFDGAGINPLPSLSAPSTGDLWGYSYDFFGTALHKTSERLRARTNRAREFWRIARGIGDVMEINPDDATDLPVRAHIMAAPFLFEHKGETWVFYEAMNADGGDGWIECARLTERGAEPSVVALSRPHHLSYPFVFQDDGEIYMIPETQQSQRLEIWRATEFPKEWALHATAFEGQYLAESSLFRADDGQWWLLTNLSDHHAFQDHSSELYLFAVDGPDLKSITPHPRNPVVFGADVARNGGAVFRHNGRFFRPAQNNSFGVYGYGLNLMEISRLDASGYEEKLVRQFTPADKSGSVALHHLSVAGDQNVFDWSGQ